MASAGILLQFQLTHCACIGFVQMIKRNETEMQFLLVSPLQGTLIEVHKGLVAIGTGDEMRGDSTQKVYITHEGLQ